MPRFKLVVEYDGTRFHGWQHQQDGTSVQEAVERAITAFSGETRRIVAAGRTDTGVHATHQVVHVDLERDWPLRTIADAMNAHLKGGGVAILDARRVADIFDARISAVKRHYLYRIINRRAFAVQAGADRLIGKHDFTTFRASECQAKSPLRTLERLDVEREGDEIRIRASARSFLHSQVRSIVGSLSLVATGKWTPDDLESALKACDRSRCGPLAPPDGLYLVGVDYDGADQPV
jgi:tRNA pseudouridine38-40 synthase